MKNLKIKFILRFIWALIKHIIDLGKKTKKFEYNMRLHECMKCEYKDKTPRPWEHCDICGCPVREKASWRSETCPKNKW